MSLFLVSCMDTVSLPTFPSLTKSEQNKSDDYAFTQVKKIKTETLLSADGNWNLVEQGGAMDPTQAHLLARKKVDTKRRKKMDELSAHFEPNAKSGEDGKIRVLRLESDGVDIDDFKDFDVAGSAVVKATHTIAEGDLRKKIKYTFGEAETVIPTRKPILTNSVATKALGKKPTSSEERIVGGVVLPPATPSRKAKNTLAVRDVPVKVRTQVASITKNGIIVPKRKPARVKNSKSHVQVLQGVRPGAGLSSAISLRSGKHPGKTRLVIEVTKTTKYKVALDSVRNTLRVKLYDTNWNLNPQERFVRSNLLGTYVARNQKDGSILLEVRLKKKTKILDTLILKPNIASKYRVVIDLQG